MQGTCQEGVGEMLPLLVEEACPVGKYCNFVGQPIVGMIKAEIPTATGFLTVYLFLLFRRANLSMKTPKLQFIQGNSGGTKEGAVGNFRTDHIRKTMYRILIFKWM